MLTATSITAARGDLEGLVESLADPLTVIEGSIITLARSWHQLDRRCRRALLEAAHLSLQKVAEVVAALDHSKREISHGLRNSLVAVGFPVRLVLDEWDALSDGDKREWIGWSANEVTRMKSSFVEGVHAVASRQAAV